MRKVIFDPLDNAYGIINNFVQKSLHATIDLIALMVSAQFQRDLLHQRQILFVPIMLPKDHRLFVNRSGKRVQIWLKNPFRAKRLTVNDVPEHCRSVLAAAERTGSALALALDNLRHRSRLRAKKCASHFGQTYAPALTAPERNPAPMTLNDSIINVNIRAWDALEAFAELAKKLDGTGATCLVGDLQQSEGQNHQIVRT